jgi:hypothetical protein
MLSATWLHAVHRVITPDLESRLGMCEAITYIPHICLNDMVIRLRDTFTFPLRLSHSLCKSKVKLPCYSPCRH